MDRLCKLYDLKTRKPSVKMKSLHCICSEVQKMVVNYSMRSHMGEGLIATRISFVMVSRKQSNILNIVVSE